MIESLLTQKVQLGFDIATSVTIIGALLSWGWESRRQSARNRKIGINDISRATSLEKVQSILKEFEDSFGELISLLIRFGNPILSLINRSHDLEEYDYTPLKNKIKSDNNFIPEQIIFFSKITIELDNIYETIQKRRYSLIPVLDSLSEDNDFLSHLIKDIDDIESIGYKLKAENLLLLQQYHELVEYTDTLGINPSEYVEDEGFMNRVYSIIMDPNYYYLTSSLVPADSRNEYKKLLKDKDLEKHQDIFTLIVANLAYSLTDERKYDTYSFILDKAIYRINKARKECKDILIKLSSLTYALLSSSDEISMKSVVARYESDSFFGKERTFR